MQWPSLALRRVEVGSSFGALVFIPRAVSTGSWNLLFLRENTRGAYVLRAQEAYSLDTRLNPPKA